MTDPEHPKSERLKIHEYVEAHDNDPLAYTIAIFNAIGHLEMRIEELEHLVPGGKVGGQPPVNAPGSPLD
jgi:hypothetical protein